MHSKRRGRKTSKTKATSLRRLMRLVGEDPGLLCVAISIADSLIQERAPRRVSRWEITAH